MSVGGHLLGMQAKSYHQKQKSTKFPIEQVHFGGFTRTWRARGPATTHTLQEGSSICKGCFSKVEKFMKLQADMVLCCEDWPAKMTFLAVSIYVCNYICTTRYTVVSRLLVPIAICSLHSITWHVMWYVT